MGAISNLIRNAGDFFNSTEMESPRYENELHLQQVPYSYIADEDTDDEDDAQNELERFFIAKRKNSDTTTVKDRLLVREIADAYHDSLNERQLNVSYMVDDEGMVVKM